MRDNIKTFKNFVNKKNKKKYLFTPGPGSLTVENLIKGTGITSSFLDYNELKILYKKFEKISVIENISFDRLTNKKIAFWNLILKKR